MKRLLLILLVCCICLGTFGFVGCGTQAGNIVDSESETNPTTTAGKPDDGNKGELMDMITICGKKLSDFRIIADKADTPAGKYLQTTIKEKTKAKFIFLDTFDNMKKSHAKMSYVSVATLPIYGENFSLADNEVKFFEQDGNFRIVVGSRKVSELTAAQYFVEYILDGSVLDLKGYSETVKLQKDEIIAPYIEKAETAKQKIENAENHYSAKDVTKSGKCFYVSYSEGSDSNDGLSPQKPWKTINKVSETSIPAGSVVLFKRGDTWRLDDYSRGNTDFCYFKLQSDVIYSSYGTGKKPIISGSPRDLAKTGTWSETAYKNVWKYSEPFNGMSNINKYYNDVGNLIFNNGEAFGYKLIKGVEGHKVSKDMGPGGFSGIQDLTTNYEFWFDPQECCVYLYYDGGNPGTCFDSIEAAVRLNLMRANNKKNIIVDNFILAYGGAHGISTALVDQVRIQNCEFKWIGGGIYDSSISNVRYGNGIEFNLNSKNCWADGNTFYQIYDAGVTHQFDTRNTPGSTISCVHENINYINNVFEYCIYSVEYFESHTNTRPDLATRYQENITISDNYLMYSGYGFGIWRDKEHEEFTTHIRGWDHPDYEIVDGTMKVENNVFLLSKYSMITATTESDNDVSDYRNNIFVQLEGNWTILIGTKEASEKHGKVWNPEVLEQNQFLKGKGNRFLTVR